MISLVSSSDSSRRQATACLKVSVFLKWTVVHLVAFTRAASYNSDQLRHHRLSLYNYIYINIIHFYPPSKADPCRSALVGILDLHLCHHCGGKVAGWKPAQFPGCNQPCAMTGYGTKMNKARFSCRTRHQPAFQHAVKRLWLYAVLLLFVITATKVWNWSISGRCIEARASVKIIKSAVKFNYIYIFVCVCISYWSTFNAWKRTLERTCPSCVECTARWGQW